MNKFRNFLFALVSLIFLLLSSALYICFSGVAWIYIGSKLGFFIFFFIFIFCGLSDLLQTLLAIPLTFIYIPICHIGASKTFVGLWGSITSLLLFFLYTIPEWFYIFSDLVLGNIALRILIALWITYVNARFITLVINIATTFSLKGLRDDGTIY